MLATTNALPVLICTLLLYLDDPSGLTLRGTVVDAAGKPIAGARVGIASAAPRVGQALFCPSCYKDCAKSTRTNERGRFEIIGLDPNLKFTVLISAPGNKSQWTPLVDPLGDELKIALAPLPANSTRERTLLGHLIDDRGQPVADALLEPYGAKTADRRWFGQVSGVDPVVSDAEGRFSIELPEGFQTMDVKITAHGYAGATVLDLKPGGELHSIVLPTGTRVTGRLVHSGQPTVGLRVAVVQLERTSGHHFIKAVGAVTDSDGRFAFEHLPANEGYAIFTLVGEGAQQFVVTTKRFKAHGDRQERDLGDLPVIDALRLAGRLEAPAGQSLPADSRVMLVRDPAWDLISVPVDKDGKFIIEGLPPETYAIRAAAKGFEIDGKGIPYQLLGPQSLGLRMWESVEDMHIPLVAGGAPGSKPEETNRKDK